MNNLKEVTPSDTSRSISLSVDSFTSERIMWKA